MPRMDDASRRVTLRLRSIGAGVAAAAGLGCAAALAQDSPPPTTHRAPDGIAANARGTVKIVGNRKVKILLHCSDGSVPCRGSFALETRRPVRTRAGGPRRIVTVAGGPYGEIPAGDHKRVTYHLRRRARFHVLRHASTATRRIIRIEGSPDPVHLFLPDRVDVLNPEVADTAGD